MFPQSARSSPYDRADTWPNSAEFIVFVAGSLVVRYLAAARLPSLSEIRAYLRLGTCCAGIALATSATALRFPSHRGTASEWLPTLSSAAFRPFLNSPLLDHHDLRWTVSLTASRRAMTRPRPYRCPPVLRCSSPVTEPLLRGEDIGESRADDFLGPVPARVGETGILLAGGCNADGPLRPLALVARDQDIRRLCGR